MNRILVLLAMAATAAAFGLFCNDNFTLNSKSGLMTEAQAIIGRPLTPLSYAGVARRTVRRCAVGVYYC